jgi:hypothetical protein
LCFFLSDFLIKSYFICLSAETAGGAGESGARGDPGAALRGGAGMAVSPDIDFRMGCHTGCVRQSDVGCRIALQQAREEASVAMGGEHARRLQVSY